MKRFFSFALFLLLLVLTVASLQVWSDRQHRAYYGWRRALLDLMEGDHGVRRPEKYTVATGPRIDPREINVLEAMSRQRVLLARAVVPSVVSITSSRVVEMPTAQNDPFAFFHHGVHMGGPEVEEQVGSGAVVTKEGHVVTNNHVIAGMQNIEVELSDGRRRPARLIGTDPGTDLAVLKIEAGDLQPLSIGDSEAVEVGETVMAVGNPYGLEESVTQGIISAKNRHSSEVLADLFQTDSQVNPGNSGGPLVNVRGELIGINDAIITDTGRFQGVSFAIPSATVRRTLDNILRLGHVLHGYLGIQRALTPENAREHGVDPAMGVVVDSVVAGSPAEKAAILPGDIIQKFNQKPVRNFDDLRRGVAEVEVDTAVPVEVSRNGKTVSVTARIVEPPPPETQFSHRPHPAPALRP